jgi:hypothetical protein
LILTSANGCAIGFRKAGGNPPGRKEEARDMIEKSGGRPSRRKGVSLTCDGRDIPMNPFVQGFIEETVLGMVRALEGTPRNPGTIDLRITRK